MTDEKVYVLIEWVGSKPILVNRAFDEKKEAEAFAEAFQTDRNIKIFEIDFIKTKEKL